MKRCSTVFALAAFALIMPVGHALAAPTQLDDQGTWSDPFVDGAGIATLGTLAVDSASGGLTLGVGATSGSAVTKSITPAAFSRWTRVLIKHRALTGQSVALYFRDSGGSDHALTLGPTSVPGFSAEATFNTSAATSPSGAIRIDLSGTNGSPLIDQLQVEWAPQALVRVGLERTGAASICSGAITTIEVPVSVSHVVARDLVVSVPLVDGVLTPDMGFDDRLRFVSATHGGAATGAAPITLANGQTVGAYRAYWSLGDVPAGDTLRLRLQVQIPVGTLTTTAYGPIAASASASNAITATSPTTSFSASSNNGVQVTKTGIGFYSLGGVNRIFASTPTTPSVARFRVTVRNTAANLCGSRYLRGVVWDPLSGLVSGGNPIYTGEPFDLVNFTQFTTAQTPHAGAPAGSTLNVPANSLMALMPTLEPGQSWTGEFSVTLATTAPLNTTITNVATANSGYQPQFVNRNGNFAFQIGIDATPRMTGLKGESIAGNAALSASDDFPLAGIGPGDVHTYLLTIQNDGASVLRDTFMFDKIPAPFVFEDLFVPTGTGAVLYYNVTGAANATTTPPDFASNTLGASWTTIRPSDKTTIKWIVVAVPAIASNILADPAGRPRQVVAQLTVRDTTSASSCTTQSISNVGYFRANGYEDFTGAYQTPGSTLAGSSFESTSIKPVTPSFETLLVTPSPAVTTSAGQVAWTIDVTNLKPGSLNLTDDATNVVLDIALPTTSINGVASPLPLVSVDSAGGTVNYGGLPRRITITWGRIPRGAQRLVHVITDVPPGVVDGSAANLVATVTGQDDTCGQAKSTASGAVAFQVTPYLQLVKRVDYKVAEPGDQLTYTLSASNRGDAAALEAVVFDRLPSDTRFARVVTHHGERCWFSDALPPTVPSDVDDDALELGFVFASGAFVEGVEGPAGTWTSPLGAATRWLACELDDPTLSPPQLPADGVARDLEVVVTIAANTPLTSVIIDQASIDADGLLVAVSNAVQTLVAADPSVDIADTCPTATANGEAVHWRSRYTNRSTQDDDTLTITTTLPAGSIVRGFSWTLPTAVPTTESFGTAPAGEFSSTTLVDGRLELTWRVHLTLDRVTGDARLLPLKTVELDLAVETSGATDGAILEWSSSALATAGDGLAMTSTTVQGGCFVPVHDPNPGIVVLVDRPLVLPGDIVTFEIIVRNRGLHDGENILITNLLPPGLDYIEGSTIVITPGWTFAGGGEPSQSGQALSWNLAQGNPISGTSFVPGTLPLTSGDIHFTIQATTLASIPTSVDLDDCGTIAMGLTASGDTLTDTDLSDNESCVTLRSPGPDPTVLIDGPAFLLPGNPGSYQISTWNVSPRAAEGVVVFYRVPDLDNDGAPDVTLLGATPLGGEIAWYSDAASTTPPAYTFNPPAAPGGTWAATPSALTGPVSWVAFAVGHLDGFSATHDFEVRISARQPLSPFDLSLPGELHTHAADVAMLSTGVDDDLTNNHDDTTTRIPGVDIRLVKTCSPESAYPGARPGDAASFTIKVTNKGAVSTFGLRVADLVPAWLEVQALTPLTATVTGANGQPAPAITPAGVPVVGAVVWNRDGDDWLLGTALASDAQYYRKVGLAPGASVSLTLTGTVALGILDGEVVTNSAVATLDHPVGYTGDPEEFTADNSDDCSITIYRPDPAVSKRGVALSGNTSVKPGDRIQWTVDYQNEGRAAAAETVMTDTVPAGTTFVVGSLGPIAPGMTVEYQNAAGAWTYVPTGPGPDANIKAFRIKFATFPAPLNDVFGANSKAAFDRGVYHGTMYDPERGGVGIDMTSPDRFAATYTTEPIAANGATVASWTTLVMQSAAAEIRPLSVDVVDATTLAPLVTDAVLDAGGAASLAGVDAQAHPQIRLVVKFPAPSEDTVERLPSLTTGANPPRGMVRALLDNDLLIGESAGVNGVIDSGTVTVWRNTGLAYSASALADPAGRFTAFHIPTQYDDGYIGSGDRTWFMPEGMIILNATDTSDANRIKAVKVVADGAGYRIELLPCPFGLRCTVSGVRPARVLGSRINDATSATGAMAWVLEAGSSTLTMLVPETEGALVEDSANNVPNMQYGNDDPADLPSGYSPNPVVALGAKVPYPQYGYEGLYWRSVPAGVDGFSATRLPDRGFGINQGGLVGRGGIAVGLADDQIPVGSGQLVHCSIWDFRSGTAVRIEPVAISNSTCTSYVRDSVGLHTTGPFVLMGDGARNYGIYRPNGASWTFTQLPGGPNYTDYPNFGFEVNNDRALDLGFIAGYAYDATFKYHLYIWHLDAAGTLTRYEPLDATLLGSNPRLQAMLSDGVFLIGKDYSNTRWAVAWNGTGFTVQTLVQPSGGNFGQMASGTVNPVDHSAFINGPGQAYLAIPDGPPSAPVRFIPTGMSGGSTYDSPGAPAFVAATPLANGCWAATGGKYTSGTANANTPGDITNTDNHSEIRLFHCPGERAPETLKRLVAVYRGTGTPSVTYETEVLPVCQLEVSNTVAISTSSVEVSTANNESRWSLPLEKAELALTATLARTVLAPGASTLATFTLTNHGVGDATDVSVDLASVNGLELNNFVTGDPFGPSYTWDVGDLAAGASTEIRLQVVVPAGTVQGSMLGVSGAVTSASLDCSPEDDQVALTTLVGSAPNVWVTLAGPPSVGAGGTVTWTINYGNNGNAPATNVVVTNTPPGGITVVGPGTVAVGTLPPGGTGSFTVTTTIDGCDLVGDSLVDLASISATEDAYSDDNQASVTTLVIGSTGGSTVLDDDCDLVDDDCDGSVDEDSGNDTDGDGFTGCTGDCDDADPNAYPNAPEVCDGVDNDCDSAIDEGATICTGSDACSTVACMGVAGCVATPIDGDGDGYGVCVDCNDGNTFVHPGALEVCDGVDNDCDDLIDPAGPTLCDDGQSCTSDVCDPIRGCLFAPLDSDEDGSNDCIDCDDGNGAVHPGATEVCNTIDDDCDTQTDEGIGSVETCNGLDDDCNGQTDEGGDTLCADDDACTNNVCNGLAGCASTPRVCNDDDVCTADSCSPTTGCVATPIPPRSVSCGVGDCSVLGTETCANGQWTDDCGDGPTIDVPDTSCSEERVAYAIVADANGQPYGTIRCYQNVTTGASRCETVSPDSLELRIFDAFFCPLD